MTVCAGAHVFAWQVVSSNPFNPIRNIRMFMPSFERIASRMPFHPYFLKSLRRFATLRFMDMQAMNNAAAINWADRALPGK